MRHRSEKMKRFPLFFAFLLPALWVGGAIVSYLHPGDEYWMFVVSSIAGTWICFLIPDIGHLRDVLIYILIAGGAILGAVGYLMDRLGVRRLVWIGLFVACSVGLFLDALAEYPSLERAIGKNGSITAYAAFAFNLAIYLSTLLYFAGAGSMFLVRMLARGRLQQEEATVEPGAQD
jgi:hypothetical protein